MLKIDTGPSTDGNPAWPYFKDEYGNLQYSQGVQPIGDLGETYADVGLPTYSSLVDGSELTTPVEYVATRVGNWIVNSSTDNWYSSEHGHSQTDTLTSTDLIPSFTVTYINPDADDGSPGDVGTTDHVHLRYTDGIGSDGASATGNLYVTLHPANVATAINGPTSTSDPNYFSTQTYPAIWTTPLDGPGSNGEITWDPCYAVYGVFSVTGSTLQAVSGFTFESPISAAVLNAAGVSLSEVGSMPESTASVSFDGLWPTGSTGAVNVWSGDYCPGWAPGVTPEELPDPLVAQYCTCTVNEVVAYRNNAYANDQWATWGYAGYNEYLVGSNPGSGMPEATWTYSLH